MPKKANRSAEATPYDNSNRNTAVAQGIKTTHDKVMQVLEDTPPARSSDKVLISNVYWRFYGVFDEPFYMVMMMDELPSFETIRRCRQRIQQEHEELRAVPPIEKERINRQIDFIDYARGDAYV